MPDLPNRPVRAAMTPVRTNEAEALSIAARPKPAEAVEHRPLVVFAAAFTAGIGAAAMLGDSDARRVATALVVFLIASCVLFVRNTGRTRLWLLALIGMGVCLGGLRYAASRIVPVDDVSRWAPAPGDSGRSLSIAGEIATDPEPLNGRVTFLLNVRAIESQASQPATGQVYVTVRHGSTDYSEAAGDDPVEYGDIVIVHGRLETPKPRTNPGAFSWRDYLARRGIYCTLAVKRPGAVEIVRRGGDNPALAAAWRVRQSIVRMIETHLPPTESVLLEGILIGWRARLAPDLSADFIRTGTVHILASAGLHVGILLGCLWLLLNRLTVHRKLAAGGLIGILILYDVICGGRPSVTRAVIMAVVYLGAVLFEREPDLPSALAAAALGILAVAPYSLLEPGFQLSFATVVTLALAMPSWDRIWRPRIDRARLPASCRRSLLFIVELAGLSIFAQLGSAPIVASAYNEASAAGVLANFAVVPVLFIVIPLGVGAVILGRVPLIGPLLFLAIRPCLDLIELIVRWFGEWSRGLDAIQTPSPAAVCAYYLALGGVLWLIRRRLDNAPGSS